MKPIHEHSYKKSVPLKSSNALHGWLSVDKPLGMTSTQVVSLVRKSLKIKKVGHGGTLDPLASGVLPLAIGEATKTVSYIQDTWKTYEFEVTWGESRSTDDEEGPVVDRSEVRPPKERIRSILSHFIGEINQVPPCYSAIKVHGKRAYALARKGKDVTLNSRKVFIKKLDLLKCPSSEKALFRVVCGKGTYVRALSRDMAKALGTVGYVSFLRRSSVGRFSVDNSIDCQKVLELGHQVVVNKGWYSICAALDDILAITVSVEKAKKIRQGQRVECPDYQGRSLERVLCVRNNNVPVALGSIKQGDFVPERVFNINLTQED